MKKLFATLAALAFLASVAMAASVDAKKLYTTRCIGCHGVDGAKKAPGSNAVLKGMSAQEVETALQGYKAGNYGGGGKRIMESQARNLDDEAIKGLAGYIAGF